MFHSSHLIFVKQCFLLALFGSWFWCYFCSFRFLCLQLVTLKVVSGSYLRILFNLDTEFPRNHNISLSFARKNIQINVDNSYARNSECLFMHANEKILSYRICGINIFLYCQCIAKITRQKI